MANSLRVVYRQCRCATGVSNLPTFTMLKRSAWVAFITFTAMVAVEPPTFLNPINPSAAPLQNPHLPRPEAHLEHRRVSGKGRAGATVGGIGGAVR
jgi:hypothetical protein